MHLNTGALEASVNDKAIILKQEKEQQCSFMESIPTYFTSK